MSAPAPRPPIASPRGLTTTRELRPSDVAGVVELHLALFPEYFLTHLGRAFLGRFYAGFARGGADFGFVAEANGQPVGFVVGTLDPADVYRRFYRRNLLHLGPIVLDRIVRDAYVRRHLGPRLRHLALAAVSLLQPGTRPARAPRPEHAARRPEHAARRPEHAARRPEHAAPRPAHAAPRPAARLMSIAVHEGHRGTGVAQELAERFCRRCTAEGVGLVGLSVRAENRRAIAFYDRSGWRREGASSRGINFVRRLAA